MTPGPEDIAHQQIDRMLEQAGWVVQDAKTVNPNAKKGAYLEPGFGIAE
jgi:predicted type IV restriction endonuclease